MRQMHDTAIGRLELTVFSKEHRMPLTTRFSSLVVMYVSGFTFIEATSSRPAISWNIKHNQSAEGDETHLAECTLSYS